MTKISKLNPTCLQIDKVVHQNMERYIHLKKEKKKKILWTGILSRSLSEPKKKRDMEQKKVGPTQEPVPVQQQYLLYINYIFVAMVAG